MPKSLAGLTTKIADVAVGEIMHYGKHKLRKEVATRTNTSKAEVWCISGSRDEQVSFCSSHPMPFS
jgi:hypothetical protein